MHTFSIHDYTVRLTNISKWIKQFLLAGLTGLMRSKYNQHYLMEIKLAAVKDYLRGDVSNQGILSRYKIRNIFQLRQWVIRYNSDKLVVSKSTRKRIRVMVREVSFDEKKSIVQWTIKHDNNYQTAADNYNVSYQ